MYQKWFDEGRKFPCNIAFELQANTPVCNDNFSFRILNQLEGTVSYCLDDNTIIKTYHVNLNKSPLVCIDNCVLRIGVPCMYAIA